jgi:hypothetical protein
MDMERETFDDLTRTLSGTSTRRRFGGLLTAIGLGTVAGLGLLGAADTDAKQRHKKKKATLCRNGQTIQVGKRKLKQQLRLGATKGACAVDTTGLQQPCSYDGQCIGELVCQVANSQNGNPERATQPVCCVPADVHGRCEDGSDCCGLSVICNGGYCQSS